MNAVWTLDLLGMRQDAARLERIANNLSNVTTPGYRREILLQRPQIGMVRGFDAWIAGQAEATAAPVPATTYAVAHDSRPGTLRSTGQALDLALLGPGYFEVRTAQGIAYTRLGRFHLDARGRVVNDAGQALLGDGGEIVLNSAQVSIDAQGDVFEGGRAVARIRAREFPQGTALQALGSGLYRVDGAASSTDADTRIRQGHLENANVDAAQEMVTLSETMRHFESLQRAAQGLDDMLGTAIRRLGEA